MATKPTVPATNNAEAIELNIFTANQFQTLVFGGVDDEVETYEGGAYLPSVAKALNEMATYKGPIPWIDGGTETDILQPREFGGFVYVPTRVPAPMGIIPTDSYWKLYMQSVDTALSDVGFNYYREEVVGAPKQTFDLPFDFSTQTIGGQTIANIRAIVYVGGDTSNGEQIDKTTITYVDGNTITLPTILNVGDVVEIGTETIASFSVISSLANETSTARDEAQASAIAAEAAKDAAEDAASTFNVPIPNIAYAGKALIGNVAGDGYAIGGDAGSYNVGSNAGDLVTNLAVDAKINDRASLSYAPQSIVRAQLGDRPVGWTAADCDAPVESMTASGTIVTVQAGLQVAYADNGRVRISEILGVAQSIDLSLEIDGTYYIAVNILSDNSFSTPTLSNIAPEIGSERYTLGSDLYNNNTINMLDSADAPIRRVYLGSVIKAGGSIVSVNCYALGTKSRVPVNNGSNVVGNVSYSVTNPFGYDGVRIDAKYKKDSEWRPHPTIYYYGTTGYGRRYGKLNNSTYSWSYKDYVDSDAPGNVNNVPVVIIFERGY